MRDRLTTIGLLIALVILAVVFLGLTGGGSGENPLNLEPRARQAVQTHGYSNPQYTGYEYWACGKGAQGWNYTATNPAGVPVNLTACTQDGILGINTSWWIVTR